MAAWAASENIIYPPSAYTLMHTRARPLSWHTLTHSAFPGFVFFLPSFFFLPEWQKHQGVLTVISSASLSLFSVKGIFQGNTLLLCGCVCVCVRHVCKWACVFITTGVGWIKAGCVIDSHLHNLCWINLADKHASGLKKKKIIHIYFAARLHRERI